MSKSSKKILKLIFWRENSKIFQLTINVLKNETFWDWFSNTVFFMSFSKHMLSMNLTFWTLDSLETQMNFSTDFRERPFGQSRFSLHLQLILSILPCHFSQIIYKSRFAWSIWTCLFNLDLPCQSGLAFSIQTCLFNPDLPC